MCEECIWHRPDYTMGRRTAQWDKCASPKVEREQDRIHAEIHEAEDRAMASVVTYPPKRDKPALFCKNVRMDWRSATTCGPAGEFFEQEDPDKLARKYRFGRWRHSDTGSKVMMAGLFAVVCVWVAAIGTRVLT